MLERRRARIYEVISKRQTGVAVLLENVEDPHNISAVMRSMDAVGVQELYVLQTKNNIQQKWGRKSSASAQKWLTVHRFFEIADCVKIVRQRYSRLLCAYLDASAPSLYSLDLTEPVALVFGNEKWGISEELRQNCDGSFIIPQQGMVHSLNISVACAVSLYELFRQRLSSNKLKQLANSTREQLFSEWCKKD